MLKQANEIKQPRSEKGQYAQKSVSRFATIRRRTILTLKTLAFCAIVAGSVRVYYPFFCGQLETCIPEIRASETVYIEQREIQADRLNQATEKITTGQQLVNEGLEEKAAIEQELKALDDQILKGKLGL